MASLFKAIISIILFSSLISCTTKPAFQIRPANEVPAAYAFGLTREFVQGGDFVLTTYQRITNPDAPFVFYLEGDGSIWDYKKRRLSEDPTPKMLTLLKLAALDNRPNIVYVARPCQYTPMAMNPKCSPEYWSGKRFSDDSIESLNTAINNINKNRQKFSLVGFSGGGGLSVLIAARNPLVKDILTIAANLDTEAFVEYHNSKPMIGSLNPIHYAKKTSHVPQLHLSGGKDMTVPSFIADEFVRAANSKCVKQLIVPEASHHKGWSKLWLQFVYRRPISCN